MSREMKDSGIEWIGEIPGNWEITKVKYLATLAPKCDTSSFTDTTEVVFSPMECVKNGYYIMRTANFETYNSSYNMFENGDIAIAKVTPCFENGNIAIMNDLVNGFGFGSSELFILRCFSGNSKFLFYNLQNSVFIDRGKSIMTGTGGLKRVSAEFVKNYYMCLPSAPEQHRIVDYLDIKCAEIDSIIEHTKTSIVEYKAYKQSVITEAVIKGLNPNAPMKDSGVEWIGEIPRHWGINMLSQLFNEVKCKNVNMKETNLLSLSYGKIKQKNINTTGGLLPENFSGYNIIEADDIVLRLTDLQNDRTSLRVGLSTQRGIITSAYITIRNLSDANPEYLYYYLHSFDIHKGFYGMGSGVRQGLTFDGIKYMKIVLPPIEEQNRIISFINDKRDSIDEIIEQKTNLVSELESYKKFLIYEFVTGKQEVS